MAKTANALRYPGGKSYLAAWHHSLAPPSIVENPDTGYAHRMIVCAGGLGELMGWQPTEGIAEVVNDVNGELANFWHVMSTPALAEAFIRQMRSKPLSRSQWEHANGAREFAADSDPVYAAALFFVGVRQSRMGAGKDYVTPTGRTRRGMNEQVSAWLSAVDGLPAVHKRMLRVEVENQDFETFITRRDRITRRAGLFYVDPPYHPSTRHAGGGEYGQFEMTHEDHERLLSRLATIEGRFMLCGYHCDLYDEWASSHGFPCHEKTIDNKASSAREKKQEVECLWVNY